MKILMWAIIPIAFTLIFFITIDYKQSESWICLMFVWFAYLIASVSGLSSYGNQYTILNYTIVFCAVGYFLLELLAATVFLYIYTGTPRWAFSIQLLLLVAYVLLLGIVSVSNYKTKKSIQDLNNNVNLVNQWKTKVTLMQLNNPSDKTKELLALLNATPVKSNSSVKAIDEKITSLIEDPLSVDIVIRKVKERNIILKTINHE